MSDGSLVRMDPTMIGATIQHDIELIIIGEYITTNINRYIHTILHGDPIA